ncbi:MAG: D-hexose-6-phosphate mutarotase [Dermabacter sp.]|nr:D-hexose-6-phosphate mutarotase [Dermabacter sp.]
MHSPAADQSPELPPSIRREKHGEADALVVTTAHSRLVMYLSGAHIVSWVPDGGEDLLWLSPLASTRPGTSVRGGVPLIGPWFGSGVSGAESPAHGWLRTAPFALEWAREEADGSVSLSLVTGGVPASVDPRWALAEVRLVVRVGQTLDLDLTLTAGASPIEVEAAFHTYFAVREIQDVELSGLADAPFVDTRNDRTPGVIAREPFTFRGPTDLVMTSGAPLTLTDPGLRRDVEILPREATRTVVWTPWREGTANFTDIPEDQWNAFVCVETAISEDGRARLAPHESARLGVRYSLSTTLTG